MPHPAFNRAARVDRAELAVREAQQNEVIEAVAEAGDIDIAARLARCQYDRQHRLSGWPWRCGSAGCWQCRRTIQRHWWRGYLQWLTSPDLSLAAIPVSGHMLDEIKRLRRGLRDVRDRAARRDQRWAAVAMAGLLDGDQMLVLLQHPGISRLEVWSVLVRRWPDVIMNDAGTMVPSSSMTVEHAADLARRKRGIEPLRVVIPAQVAAFPANEIAPMPSLF